MSGSAISIDLNADLGEGFGPYGFGEDEALLRIVSSANVACGFHAGDPSIMRRTVEQCLEHGVAIGAHPGLPDRLGFGRREMRITAQEAGDWLTYQLGALQAIAAAAGGEVRHVKPHGALYHMVSKDEVLAEAVVRAIRAVDGRLLVYGPPNSRLREAAERAGLAFAAEGFADRAYAADGSLVSRETPGALLETEEQALGQALSLAKYGYAVTPEGVRVKLDVRTICIHGDAPGAAERAALLARGLLSAGVSIAAPCQIGGSFVER